MPLGEQKTLPKLLVNTFDAVLKSENGSSGPAKRLVRYAIEPLLDAAVSEIGNNALVARSSKLAGVW